MSGNPTVKTIIFGGELGRRFGRKHRYACNTPAEALRALCILIEGLEKFLRDSPLKYKVFLNRKGVKDAETELRMNHSADEYAVMPVMAGAKNSAGFTQIIVGAVLFAIGFFIPSPASPYLMAAGISMMVGGAVTLLIGVRKPNIAATEEDKNKPSYYVSGPVNTTSQGQCVPVGYGEFIGGSAVVSASVTPVDIPVN